MQLDLRETGGGNGKCMYYFRMRSSLGSLFQWHWKYWWTKCY